jgi:negative regulator of genetic competence, sporulation and motility
MTATLKSPKSTGRTPEGRESWKDAKNQAKGNLNWMLSFLDSKEIIGILVNQKSKQIREIYPISKRYCYLQSLENYLSSMEKECKEEINRLEEFAKPEDLEEPKNTSLEEVFCNE